MEFMPREMTGEKKKWEQIPDQHLDSYEQEIEDAVDAEDAEDTVDTFDAVPYASPERLAELKKAQVAAQEKRKWGGQREGAGRKPKAYSKRLLNLTLEAAKIIDSEAERTGEKKSAIASRLIVRGKCSPDPVKRS